MKEVDLSELSRQMSNSALRVLEDLDFADICRRVGGMVNIVGSLKTGLMMNKADIDLHIYTGEPMLKKSFAIMERLSENSAVKNFQYINLLNTREDCIEWHVWYEGADQKRWKLDIIHIRKGSYYDGFFEKVADRILHGLTPEIREAILKIKYALGEESDVKGIQVYQAVMESGVRDYPEFLQWLEVHRTVDILEWMPGGEP